MKAEQKGKGKRQQKGDQNAPARLDWTRPVGPNESDVNADGSGLRRILRSSWFLGLGLDAKDDQY